MLEFSGYEGVPFGNFLKAQVSEQDQTSVCEQSMQFICSDWALKK